MSGTVLTSDGNCSWYSNFGLETVDEHGHLDDDLDVPPLVLTKPAGYTAAMLEAKDTDGTTIFNVQANGNVGATGVNANTCVFQQGTFTQGIELQNDAAMGFVPVDGNGNSIPNRLYRFGRASNIGDFTHEGDGIQLWGKFTKAGQEENCAVQMGILPQEPSVSIRGFKNAGENYFEIVDEDGGMVFAMGGDGNIFGSFLVDSDHAKDSYHGSSVHKGESVYIGPTRISYNNGKLLHTYYRRHPIMCRQFPPRCQALATRFTNG